MTYVGGLNSLGHQQLTVSSAAVALTMPTASARPRHALIYVGSNPVAWRADGTDPTATVGIVITAGGYLSLMESDFDYAGVLLRIRFIRTGGADAILDIEYFS